MSWRIGGSSDDSSRLGRPGGDWRGIRPTFDNPMTWSLPLMRVFGIAVRVHLVFLIFVIVRLAKSLVDPTIGAVRPGSFELAVGPGVGKGREHCEFGQILFDGQQKVYQPIDEILVVIISFVH